MGAHYSLHTGPEIDEGVSDALPGGRLDQAIQAAIKTAVSQAAAQLAAQIHADQHGADGTDPITPASIGALPLDGGDISGVLRVAGGVIGGYFKQSEGGYGTPSEFGQYLDLHVDGSTADYDFRLFLDAKHNLYCQKPGETAELILHTGNAAASGMGGGLTLVKTLTVPEDDIEELEFQLTVDELTKYKRFVIFPKLEVEYKSNTARNVYLEAPTFGSDGVSISLGPVCDFPTNGLAMIAVGTEGSSYGYTLNMLALKTFYSSSSGTSADLTSQATSSSTSAHKNPTTSPLTFRIYAAYPFIKGGTVSIMGVN